MKYMIVYDSVFGNTEKVAMEMGKALGGKKQAEVVKVDAADFGKLKGVKVLVVGSPTRAFSPTPATVAFLKGIPANSLKDVKVAAFDTRFPMNEKVPGILKFLVGIFGYAAKPIADRLVKKGGSLAAEPEGFFVTDSEGPLADGELKRAAEWVNEFK
jgi:flavodoxin